MLHLDFPALLENIGATVVKDAEELIKSEALPQELRDSAKQWAAIAAQEMVKAATAKAKGDMQAYSYSMRELSLLQSAVDGIVTAELMIGLSIAEREARKAVSMVLSQGISIGLKVLLAVAV